MAAAALGARDAPAGGAGVALEAVAEPGGAVARSTVGALGVAARGAEPREAGLAGAVGAVVALKVGVAGALVVEAARAVAGALGGALEERRDVCGGAVREALGMSLCGRWRVGGAVRTEGAEKSFPVISP